MTGNSQQSAELQEFVAVCAFNARPGLTPDAGLLIYLIIIDYSGMM